MDARQILALITDIIIGVPIVIFILYSLYLIIKGRDLSGEFTKNPKHMVESILVISSLMEVISLSIMGLERGVSLSACLSRYGIAALLEFVFAFLFSIELTKSLKDGKVFKGEFMRCLFYFLASFFFTLIIYLFYLEAEGAITLYSNQGNIWTNKKIEIGAFFTIWCTVPLNLLNVIIQLKFNKSTTVVIPTKEKKKKDTSVEEKKEAKK